MSDNEKFELARLALSSAMAWRMLALCADRMRQLAEPDNTIRHDVISGWADEISQLAQEDTWHTTIALG